MNFKPQIQRSLPDYEKAAQEFYEKKNFNQLIVKAIKKKS